jgi:hypothetical protein
MGWSYHLLTALTKHTKLRRIKNKKQLPSAGRHVERLKSGAARADDGNYQAKGLPGSHYIWKSAKQVSPGDRQLRQFRLARYRGRHAAWPCRNISADCYTAKYGCSPGPKLPSNAGPG